MSPRDGETEEPASATLTMQIYGRPRHDIIGGVLAPGMRLKIEELRKTYNVGSSPIREALNLLTSFGLVHRLEQRGFQVPPNGLAGTLRLAQAAGLIAPSFTTRISAIAVGC